MTSSSAYELLRAVPPLDGQRRRFALLLQLKNAVHTARDATALASGQAAAFLTRLVTRLHLQAPLGWVRSTTARVDHHRGAGGPAAGHVRRSRGCGRGGGQPDGTAGPATPRHRHRAHRAEHAVDGSRRR